LHFHTVVSVASPIFFIVWWHLAFQNLPALGNSDLRFSPTWTIAAWLIPVANVIVPYYVMVEVWQGSHPGNLTAREGRGAAGASIVGLWWGLFLISHFCALVVWPPGGLQWEDAGLTAFANWVEIVGAVLIVLSGLVTIRLVNAIDRNQHRRAQLVAGQGPLGPCCDGEGSARG
jgi:hypothetical protein